MKKILSIALAIAMVLSLGVCAFADTNESTYENGIWTSNDGGSKDVTVTVNDAETAAEVCYVVVTWESMVFTYNMGSEGIWNTSTHKYDGVVVPHWEDDSATITVTSHSNVAVTASATFANDANSVTTFGVTATITGNGSIDSADADAYRADEDGDNVADAAPSAVFTVTVEDAPNEDYNAENNNIVGTITISITAV